MVDHKGKAGAETCDLLTFSHRTQYCIKCFCATRHPRQFHSRSNLKRGRNLCVYVPTECNTCSLLIAFRLRTTSQADAIMIEELNRANVYRDIGQAFAVLLPVQSVGVMGDCR